MHKPRLRQLQILQETLIGRGSLKKPSIPKHYLGAFKQGHRPTAREFIDDEFSYQLLREVLKGNKEAQTMLEYLARFYNEYYKAVFTKTKKDLLRGKRRHRERYTAQNARQRDVWVQMHQIHKTESRHLEREVNETVDKVIINDSLQFGSSVNYDVENHLIDLIDLKRDLEKSQKQ